MPGTRHRLSAEERRRFAEDGFFVRRAVFLAPELETLRAAAERAQQRAAAQAAEAEGYAIDGNRYADTADATVQYEHRADAGALRVVEPVHHLDPALDALVDDPRLVEPMRDLVGAERVALFTDKLNLKRPREGSGFGWHQDSPYWAHVRSGEALDRLPNVMLALDDASVENGCFRVLRGSHRNGMLPGREGEGVLGPLFTHPDHVRLEDQVAAEMPAGSLFFFSPHSVHGSEPNRSARQRRALVLTYQAAGQPMFKLPREREAGPGAPRRSAGARGHAGDQTPGASPAPASARSKAARSSS